MANFMNWRNGPWGPGFLMMLPNYRSAPSNLQRPPGGNFSSGAARIPRRKRLGAQKKRDIETATMLLLALQRR